MAPQGERLIVALNVPTVGEARELVRSLGDVVGVFKIGMQFQLVEGAEAFIRELIEAEMQVFLDYKYFDIGHTVREAVAKVAEAGVSFLTVHGTSDVMQAAKEGKGDSSLRILAVTLLTSLEQKDMRGALRP